VAMPIGTAAATPARQAARAAGENDDMEVS
jgi:hypothetical protein